MTLAGGDRAAANVTLLLDGSTFLRCTGPAALADGTLLAAMQAAAGRIAAIGGTTLALRSVMDVAVLGVALVLAAMSAATADGAIGKLLGALAVSAAYAALIPLRSYALRAAMRIVLRLVSRVAEAG